MEFTGKIAYLLCLYCYGCQKAAASSAGDSGSDVAAPEEKQAEPENKLVVPFIDDDDDDDMDADMVKTDTVVSDSVPPASPEVETGDRAATSEPTINSV